MTLPRSNTDTARYATCQGGITRRLVAAMTRCSGYTRAELIGRGRNKRLALARFAIVRAARKSGLSYPQIGRDLGGRDHTTAMNADQRAAELCADAPCFATLCRIMENVR